MIETLEQAKEHARKVVGCTDTQRALKLLLNEVQRLQDENNTILDELELKEQQP
ncbi:hypothetical protein [Robbsia andropogonis]|uniref:hypothetical protein n=1 Tax=Robbsia andropogonis TaxID=28092 RepID=UPI00209EDC10|nr:hypothetical protein [Robbsia andropogonis]MCP1116995.1 hypothetical protein [Robbsia andropogonis]MCP1126326.1 hypothetical protein [Robbsia andropogonis]